MTSHSKQRPKQQTPVRQLQLTVDEWELKRTADALQAEDWGRVRYSPATSFLKAKLPDSLPPSCGAALRGLELLQGGHFGVVVRAGSDLAEASGFCERTWWNDLPLLEEAGVIRKLQRGGGKMPGGNGRSNTYMRGDLGQLLDQLMARVLEQLASAAAATDAAAGKVVEELGRARRYSGAMVVDAVEAFRSGASPPT